MMNNVSNTTVTQLSMFPTDEELSLGSSYDVDNSFSYNGFQVVRGELVCDRQEPTISFNNNQFYVNTVCIKKLPETDYVQILINKNQNILAIRPCDEDDRDAFLWRTISRKTGKRQPKHITARIFTAMLFEHMGWNNHNRYRLIGKLKEAHGIKIFVFDLTSYKAFSKTTDSETNRIAKIAILPYEWQGQFGLSVEEHDRSLEVTTFKNFAVIDIKDSKPPVIESPQEKGVMV